LNLRESPIIALPKCQINRHNSRQIMTLTERRCGLTARSLPVIGGIALVLISLPSEGQTAKSLSQADIKKIDDVTQTAVHAALARDFATWASLFLDDAVIYPPNEPAVKGRAAIRAWLEKFPPITEFKLNNEKVEGREGRPVQSRTPANLSQSYVDSQMAGGLLPWICSARTCHRHSRRRRSRRAF
jgi:SnoaL-like domain